MTENSDASPPKPRQDANDLSTTNIHGTISSHQPLAESAFWDLYHKKETGKFLLICVDRFSEVPSMQVPTLF